MMVDAVFDPVEVAQAPPQESEVRAGNSWDDAIPETRTPSPARLSPELYQGPGLDNASCASSDAESEVKEAGSGSLSEAQVSSPLPSLRRFHHKSLQMYKTMQSKDGDADSEGSGSEDVLNGLESQHWEESSPSLPDGKDSGSEDDVDDVHQGRKRRKVPKSPSHSIRSTPASSRSSRQRRSATHTAQLPRGLRAPTLGIESLKPSQALPAPSEASTLLAGFEEWLLENVSTKCIIEDGKTIF
ncbi:Fc.00g081570.m01.CDS01 [Cosmosporella sp. VM-42]